MTVWEGGDGSDGNRPGNNPTPLLHCQDARRGIDNIILDIIVVVFVVIVIVVIVFVVIVVVGIFGIRV